jgi:hypothetical protein
MRSSFLDLRIWIVVSSRRLRESSAEMPALNWLLRCAGKEGFDSREAGGSLSPSASLAVASNGVGSTASPRRRRCDGVAPPAERSRGAAAGARARIGERAL